MHPPVLPLLLFLLFASPPPALSRLHSPPSATATLDVAASLSRARSAVSTDALPLHQSAAALDADVGGERSTESGSLTLQLHSRDFLPQEQGRHQSYRSLVLARLRRDSARAAAVSARAALAADGVSRADLMPANATPVFEASAAQIQGPVVSGVGQGSGEYFSRVGIGSPARQLYMVLDTGSDVTWLQCQPCADCYQQSDPVFDPSLSASYAAVGCDSPRCRDLDAAACRNSTGACLYQVAYGDGSYTVGDFATETLTLGDSAPVNNVAIGCGHDNEGLFVGAAGLLALDGGPLSFSSQISATSFSYCLVRLDIAGNKFSGEISPDFNKLNRLGILKFLSIFLTSSSSSSRASDKYGLLGAEAETEAALGAVFLRASSWADAATIAFLASSSALSRLSPGTMEASSASTSTSCGCGCGAASPSFPPASASTAIGGARGHQWFFSVLRKLCY